MLNLDQVRLLENKVERAVQMIKSLHTEKDALKKEIPRIFTVQSKANKKPTRLIKITLTNTKKKVIKTDQRKAGSLNIA